MRPLSPLGMSAWALNPLLNRLCLDQDIISIFSQIEKFKKKLCKILITSENIMEIDRFAPKDIVKYMIFQRPYYGVVG